MSLVLVTPPAVEPVSLAEAKAHLRIDDTADDAVVSALITTARNLVEEHTSRALVSQTWELQLDGWPCVIRLPRPPLVSVLSITYTDPNGAERTLAPAAYKVDTVTEPGRIVSAYGLSWPDCRDEIAAVRVRYSAGYGPAADVPAALRHAVLLTAAHLYDHRDSAAGLPRVAEALTWTYRTARP